MRKLAVAIFCCALLASTKAYTQTTWDLSRDLLAASNQISFNQGSNQVWAFMEGASTAHDPTLYRFLTSYLAPCHNATTGYLVNGVGCWHGTVWRQQTVSLFPEVALNFTDTILGIKPDVFPGYLPQTPQLTGTCDRLVMVAWRSPVTGVVSVDGTFRWRNQFKADAVYWFVDKGKQTLVSGLLWASAAWGFAKFPSLSITKDEVVYFMVDDSISEDCGLANPVDLRVTITQLQ